MNRHSAVSGRHAAGAAGEKRERILDAAVRVFAEKGFYNAKVSEIADRAGVADGTIYLYFKSKDDLLISLFEDRMEQVNANARAAIEGDGSPVEKLRRLLVRHFDLVHRNPELAEVLTVELRQSSKFLKEYKPSKFGQLLKLVALPIQAGQRDGTIRREMEAHVVARAIFGAVDELVLAWVLGTRAAGGRRGAGPRSRAGRHGNSARPVALGDPRRAIDLSRAGAQLAELFIEGLRERGTPRTTSQHAKRRAS